MTDFEKEQLASIRAGTFAAFRRDFALSFRMIRMRDGLPRTVSVHGEMPVLVIQWKGSGYPTLLQSLN
jgi:hypothetical protein